MGSLMMCWSVSCSSSVNVHVFAHSPFQVYTGVTWSMFKPCTPPVLPTPEVFLDSVVATKTEIVYCVPAFIEVRLSLLDVGYMGG